MNDKQIAQKIRTDLRAAFPKAVFQVTYQSGELDLQHIGGNNYKDQFPTKAEAAEAIAEVIRQTLPTFQVLDYE